MRKTIMSTTSPEETDCKLTRELGLVSGVNFLLMVIFGSAVFLTPGKVLAECGSVGMMLLVWVVCAIITLMNCLPFAELSTVIPKSGGIYTYIQSAFHNTHSFFGDLPAFVYFWIMFIIVLPCLAAINAELFSEFFFKVFEVSLSEDVLGYETAVKYISGALSLVLVGVVNCVSVKFYVKSQNLLSCIVMGCIAFTVVCGVYFYSSGKALEFSPGFQDTNWTLEGINQPLYLALFAYDGGWCITGITEELKNPEKNVLYSIIIALTIVSASYILLNLSFLSALSIEDISNSTTVIADFAGTLFGPSGTAIAAVLICVSLLANNMCLTFYSSRMGYVAAREGHVVEILYSIHKKLQTPIPAILVQILLALIYFFVGGDVTFLVDMCSSFLWLSYGVTMTTVFVFRRRFPNAYRPFKVPSAIPFLVIIIVCYLFFASMLITPVWLLLLFLVCVTLVVIMYCVFIYKGLTIKAFANIQKRLQGKLMLVLPRDE